jgi:hypothetical protein
LHENVGQYGDGVAALHHALHVVQGFQKGRPFDGDTHDGSNTQIHKYANPARAETIARRAVVFK